MLNQSQNNQLQYASTKVCTLFITFLIMIIITAFCRFPSVNLQVIVFAFLSSTVLFDVESAAERFNLVCRMFLSVSILQFAAGILGAYPLLQIIVFSFFSWYIAAFIRDKSAVFVVLIAGSLDFFVANNYQNLINRIVILLVGTLVALGVATCSRLLVKNIQIVNLQTTKLNAFCLSLMICSGLLIVELFKLKQGIWVILTIFFIGFAANEYQKIVQLAKARIYSVPLGLLSGMLYLSCFTNLDYRFFYLMPFLGAIGFFILYYSGNYFFFSFFFMLCFMLYADLSMGSSREFHAWQLIFARSLSSWLGVAILVIFGNKLYCRENL
ncbi:MAG: hypothetical protein IJW31_03595 [Lentisphaeria bacterium]|nr:hypothetical protein [Lentisphaeria bacterium]